MSIQLRYQIDIEYIYICIYIYVQHIYIYYQYILKNKTSYVTYIYNSVCVDLIDATECHYRSPPCPPARHHRCAAPRSDLQSTHPGSPGYLRAPVGIARCMSPWAIYDGYDVMWDFTIHRLRAISWEDHGIYIHILYIWGS